MAVPAWKLALQERKKKQEEIEKLKKEKEETQKLASLPAWRRAILLREMREKTAGAPPTSATSSVNSVIGAAEVGNSSSQQPNGVVKQHPEKWQVAVARVKGPDSPILKRAPPTSVQKASPAPPTTTLYSTSTSESSNQRPTSQRSVLNRWGAGASQSPTASRASRGTKPTSSNQRNESKSSIGSSSPASRRPSTFNSSSNGSTNTRSSVSNTGSSSPASRRPSTFNSSSNGSTNTRSYISNTGSSSPASRRPSTFNSSSNGSTNTRSSVSNTGSSSPASKRPSTSNNSPASRVTPDSKWPAAANSTTKLVNTPANSNSSVRPAATSVARDEDDLSLTKLPPWKRALILKKRRSQQQLEVENKPPVGVDETDSGPIPAVVTNGQIEEASSEAGPAAIVMKQHVPEVVNRQVETKPTEQRLVQQEGKTIHPPIYKEVDQWVNVGEEDEKFKRLPTWKQALIKRRRVDIAVRSGHPVPSSSTVSQDMEESPAKDSPVKKNEKKALVSDSGKNVKESKSSKKVGPSGSSVKSIKKQPTSKTAENRRNKIISEQSAKKRNGLTTAKTKQEKVAAGSKPARRAPAIPAVKEQEVPEPMFSYSFSKTSHRSLDTGGSSSDSTDSDLEDAIVTNLDGDSDESDSGIVLQRYTTSAEQKKGNELKHSSSSILVVPGKKKNKKMRRVSWSDSQLVSEHTYPKYDYSDYMEAEDERRSEFSHRLHPSLLPPSDGDPYSAGFSPPGYQQGGSLSSFVPSSLSPTIMETSYSDFTFQAESAQEDSSLTSGPVEHDYSDYYSDQTSNAAALLW